LILSALAGSCNALDVFEEDPLIARPQRAASLRHPKRRPSPPSCKPAPPGRLPHYLGQHPANLTNAQTARPLVPVLG
jgi:hypothetical protein